MPLLVEASAPPPVEGTNTSTSILRVFSEIQKLYCKVFHFLQLVHFELPHLHFAYKPAIPAAYAPAFVLLKPFDQLARYWPAAGIR